MKKSATVQNIDSNLTGNTKQHVPKWTLIVLGILVMAAFWGTFVYAVWVGNMGLVMVFTTIIAVSAAVYGTIHFLTKLYQHISQL